MAATTDSLIEDKAIESYKPTLKMRYHIVIATSLSCFHVPTKCFPEHCSQFTRQVLVVVQGCTRIDDLTTELTSQMILTGFEVSPSQSFDPLAFLVMTNISRVAHLEVDMQLCTYVQCK